MADVLTKEQRHKNMHNIKSRDTGIEVSVRKYLFAVGFRYRKNDKRYPGKPDIVLPKYKAIIFIHGCFWHGHEGCKYFVMPKTNTAFWYKKIHRNIERDRINMTKLTAEGWRVFTIWECQLKKARFQDTMKELISEIKGNHDE